MLTRGGSINKKQLKIVEMHKMLYKNILRTTKSDDKWIKKLIKLLTKYKIKVNI